MANYLKSPAQGAATTTCATLSKECEGKGGEYLGDSAEAELSKGSSATASGYVLHAYHDQGDKKLWTNSLEFVENEDDE